MAIAVASQSAIATNSGTTITITKPTGLAVGDLMIAHVGASTSSGGIGEWNQLSGWTRLSSANWYHTSANVGRKEGLQWKVADSSDVSASNFTFTYSTTGSLVGAIFRITGQRATTEIILGSTSTSPDSFETSSPVAYACGVTPLVNDSLLMLFILTRNGGNFENYSIATSNPTWTEAYDSNSIACAYAIRPEITATGDMTISFSESDDVGNILQLIAISPAFGVTVSPSVINSTGAVLTPTISGGTIVSPSTITATSEVKTPAHNDQADWSAVDKSDTATWSTLSKS